jgi:hypothetical protein
MISALIAFVRALIDELRKRGADHAKDLGPVAEAVSIALIEISSALAAASMKTFLA